MPLKRAKVKLSLELLKLKLRMREEITITSCSFDPNTNAIILYLVGAEEFPETPELSECHTEDAYNIFNWCPTIQLPPEWLDRINNSTMQEPGASDED